MSTSNNASYEPDNKWYHITSLINVYEIDVFRIMQNFSPDRHPRVFSRALGCGARKGPASTPRRKCGSRPGSLARALGSQSCEIWQVSTGLLSH